MHDHRNGDDGLDWLGVPIPSANDLTLRNLLLQAMLERLRIARSWLGTANVTTRHKRRGDPFAAP
jgi:hypothetical protein